MIDTAFMFLYIKQAWIATEDRPSAEELLSRVPSGLRVFLRGSLYEHLPAPSALYQSLQAAKDNGDEHGMNASFLHHLNLYDLSSKEYYCTPDFWELLDERATSAIGDEFAIPDFLIQTDTLKIAMILTAAIAKRAALRGHHVSLSYDFESFDMDDLDDIDRYLVDFPVASLDAFFVTFFEILQVLRGTPTSAFFQETGVRFPFFLENEETLSLLAAIAHKLSSVYPHEGCVPDLVLLLKNIYYWDSFVLTCDTCA